MLNQLLPRRIREIEDILYLKKGPKLDNFCMQFVKFPGEKVALEVCYDRNSSAVFGLLFQNLLKLPTEISNKLKL